MTGVCHFTLLVAFVVLLCSVPAAFGDQPGDWFDIGLTDRGLVRAMKFAISEYNKDSNEPYSRKLINVTRAKKQILSGVRYEAEVLTGLTTCMNPTVNTENCPLNESSGFEKRTKCVFHVVVIPWEKKTVVKKSYCNK